MITLCKRRIVMVKMTGKRDATNGVDDSRRMEVK